MQRSASRGPLEGARRGMNERGAECLVLVPCLLCDAAVWRHQVAVLSAEAPVQIADMQGESTIEAMAARVLREAPQRFAIAGHSLGGRVALEVVRQAASRVARLALLDTGANAAAPGERERRAALLERARARGVRVIAEEMLLPSLHESLRDDAALTAEIVAMIERADVETLERQFGAMLARPNAEPLLAEISCPTLVLCGAEDTYSPVERHVRMAAAIRGATLVVVERCGHMAPLERPDAVTAALRRWLDVA